MCSCSLGSRRKDTDQGFNRQGSWSLDKQTLKKEDKQIKRRTLEQQGKRHKERQLLKAFSGLKEGIVWLILHLRTFLKGLTSVLSGELGNDTEGVWFIDIETTELAQGSQKSAVSQEVENKEEKSLHTEGFGQIIKLQFPQISHRPSFHVDRRECADEESELLFFLR